MAKKILLGVMCLLLSISAFAGSIEINSPTFEDGDQFYNGSAKIDADTLGGITYKQIKNKINNNKYINENQQEELDNLNSNRDAFLKDKGGISKTGVWNMLAPIKYLWEDFKYIVDYLDTIYVTRQEFEELNLRVDKLEAKVNLLLHGNYLSSKGNIFSYSDIQEETNKITNDRLKN